MHALLVVAHPSPDSFSHALAHAAREALVEREFAVDSHDLYAEGFDPVQRTGEAGNTASADALVERHCAELARADLVVVCHPNWWGQPPAILKGWIDRVFRLGTAYGYPPGVPPEGVPTGLLRAREALDRWPEVAQVREMVEFILADAKQELCLARRRGAEHDQ